MSVVAKAVPDGHTLATIGLPQMVAPGLVSEMPYDTARDFAPVTQLVWSANVLVVRASSPLATVADYVASAKARPGALTYASGGNGTPSHLASELLKYRAGIDVRHVPYKGISAGLAGLMGEQVDIAFAGIATALPLVRSGRLRALATAGAQRLPALPDLPTIAELGFAGYQQNEWYGVVAPAGTPPEVIARLAVELTRIVALPETQARLTHLGLYPVEKSGPEALAALIRAELVRWKQLVRDVGHPRGIVTYARDRGRDLFAAGQSGLRSRVGRAHGLPGRGLLHALSAFRHAACSMSAAAPGRSRWASPRPWPPGRSSASTSSPRKSSRRERWRARAGIANVRFEVANAYRLPFPDDSFDAAFANGVVMHLRQPVQALAELFRVLRPGGIAGVRDPDWGSSLYAPMTPLLEHWLAVRAQARRHNGSDPFLGRHYRRLLLGGRLRASRSRCVRRQRGLTGGDPPPRRFSQGDPRGPRPDGGGARVDGSGDGGRGGGGDRQLGAAP